MHQSDLEMVPATDDFLKEMLENPPLDAFIAEAARQTRAHQTHTGATCPWIGYFARRDGEWVGLCAFVEPPRDGAVEIAYGTAPAHQRRGIATAMAGWLIARAFAEKGIEAVVANTAPEFNASTRILVRHGFVRDGVVQDHEIGEAWHWKKRRG